MLVVNVLHVTERSRETETLDEPLKKAQLQIKISNWPNRRLDTELGKE